MIVRVATVSVPFFRHGTLAVGRAWAEFDLKAAGDEGVETLRSYVGRIIRVHPDDCEKLAALGMAIEGGYVVDCETKAQGEPEDTEETKETEDEQGEPGSEDSDDGEPSESFDLSSPEGSEPVAGKRGKKARR